MISPVESWVARRTGLLGDLTPGSLARWQLNRLGEAVAHARRHSRFYRGLPGPEPAVWSLDDLGRLPFTWPADLARDPQAFLAVPPSEVARVTTLTSSGSTGPKKRIFFTADDLERTVEFFADGMTTLVGPGQDTLILMSDATEHSIARLLRSALGRIGVAGRIAEPGWSVAEIFAAARSASCIVGLPAEILYLCRAYPGLRPHSVLLSSDYAPRSVIAAVERAWGCVVLTHYGLTEAGFGWAVQCSARDGHHLRDLDLLLEIVDPGTGARLAHGQPGEIVLTTLRNQAMPLLRYRTGDLGRILDGPCGCGGILPRLGRVEGRLEGRLPLGNGATLSIHQLDEIVFALPGVRGFEAGVRNTPSGCCLRLDVAGAGPLDPEDLAARLPPGLAFELRHAEINPFAHRSKRRFRQD